MVAQRQVHLRGFKDAETFQRYALKPGEELVAGVPKNGYIAGSLTENQQAFERELASMNRRTQFVAFALVSIDQNGEQKVIYTKSSKQARKFWGK